MSGGCKCRSPQLGRRKANSTPPNPIAGFKGHFKAVERKGKRGGRKGKENEIKERDERGRKKHPSPKNKLLVTALIIITNVSSCITVIIIITYL